MKTIQFIGISPEEQKQSIIQEIDTLLQNFKTHFEPKKPTELLTRKEVSKLLKIDLSTVHNWVKSNKLKAYSIGNRVYFKRTEVEDSLILLND